MPRFKPNMPTSIQRHDWDAAWVLYVAGATLEEVSEAMKIPYAVLIKHSAKKAWSANRAAAVKLANKGVKENLAGRIERIRAKHQHFVLDQVEEIEAVIEQTEIGATDPDTEHLPADKQSKMTVGKKIALTQRVHDLAAPILGLDREQERVDPVQAGFAMIVAMGKQLQSPALVNETKGLPSPTDNDVIEGDYTDIPQPDGPKDETQA